MVADYTGADLFVDACEQYGVEHLFGNPGTTELPVMDALSRSELEYVLGLHEDIAVGMAAGYASTRRYQSHHDPSINPVGVVNLHITPGLAHGLGNTYGAEFAGAPLVITAGNHERDFRHEEPLLHGDLLELVDQFTKWSDEVLSVDALPTMLRRAFRVALTPPTGPVFLGLPVDVMQEGIAPDAIEPLGPIPNGGGGDPAQIARAADRLVDADEPVLVVGDEIARSGTDAVDAAVAFAEATGARVHAEILGCEVNFPTEHPQWVSHLPPSEALVREAMETDTVVLAGCSTHTTVSRHEGDLVPPETTCIHLSPDAWEVGKNQPADAAVVGDPGLVLGQLAERLDDRLDDATRQERLAAVRAFDDSFGARIWATSEDETPPGEARASKADLVDAIGAVAPDAFIVDEGITSKYPLLVRSSLAPEGLLSNKGGGLGYGLPASVGAALAESTREEPRDVLGFIGDGSYLYYPQAVYSAARYDLDLTVVVADNRNYRILKDNTQALFGGTDADHDYVGMDFDPPVDLVANAESHGATAERAETPDEIAPALERALDTDGPSVVDVLVHD